MAKKTKRGKVDPFSEVPKKDMASWKKEARKVEAEKVLVFQHVTLMYFYKVLLLPSQKEDEIIFKTIGKKVDEIFIGSIKVRPKLRTLLKNFKKKRKNKKNS